MNASLDGDNIIHHQNVNMGVAVALPDDNLIVPVIHASEEKNFLGLARSTADLAGRARENNLNPDEIFGSTFTVTNPGVFGGLFGMGIINQPNVGILAVGSFQKRPVVKETEFGDTIVVRHMVYLTLSYDHRIIDGAYGTRFLSRLSEQLESYKSKRIES
jgi:2-oxoglutarate dehydrogenase E2 component (dihydrolipoamide succinyltransferase)